MKNIFLFIIFIATISCKAQTYPLRTYGIEFPKDSYQKDTNNELQDYVGTWKGTWDNKNIFITLKKTKYYKSFLDNRAYYADILTGKFKVTDSNGLVLFDNTSLSDENAKIKGSNFIKLEDIYSLIYVDPDLCNTTGRIKIGFTDSTKTQLNWNLYLGSNMVTDECPYYNTELPHALPEEIILIKQ